MLLRCPLAPKLLLASISHAATQNHEVKYRKLLIIDLHAATGFTAGSSLPDFLPNILSGNNRVTLPDYPISQFSKNRVKAFLKSGKSNIG